jgi:hypothetical protein
MRCPNPESQLSTVCNENAPSEIIEKSENSLEFISPSENSEDLHPDEMQFAQYSQVFVPEAACIALIVVASFLMAAVSVF